MNFCSKLKIKLMRNDILLSYASRDDEKHSVIAEIAVIVDKALYEQSKEMTVEQALEETVAAGRAGNLQLDPNYLIMQAPRGA